MTTLPPRITGGVDTHLEVHVAAALDHQGALLGVESFETTPAGYRALHDWLSGFGDVEQVGVEGAVPTTREATGPPPFRRYRFAAPIASALNRGRTRTDARGQRL